MSSLAAGPDVAWVRVDDVVYVAALPDPPILVLDGAAALIWVTALEVDSALLVDEIAARSGVPLTELRTDVESFVADLRSRRLLVEP